MYVSGDGTGVRMRVEELAGRKGKQPDGSAKTRQAYLGCIFTQHRRDDKGHPIRDHDSTTYVCSFDTVEDFWLTLRKEAQRRGSGTAGKIVLLLGRRGRTGQPGADQLSGLPANRGFLSCDGALEGALGSAQRKRPPRF